MPKTEINWLHFLYKYNSLKTLSCLVSRNLEVEFFFFHLTLRIDINRIFGAFPSSFSTWTCVFLPLAPWQSAYRLSILATRVPQPYCHLPTFSIVSPMRFPRPDAPLPPGNRLSNAYLQHSLSSSFHINRYVGSQRLPDNCCWQWCCCLVVVYVHAALFRLRIFLCLSAGFMLFFIIHPFLFN